MNIRVNRMPWTGMIALVASVAGCGGPSLSIETPDPNGAPPPACSPAEAPLAKVTNAATSDEYKACSVTTKAQFNSADWGVVIGGDLAGFVKWSASTPGGSDFKFMYIPKGKSDAIFKFKKGDPVTVTGVAHAANGQVFVYASEVVPDSGEKK